MSTSVHSPRPRLSAGRLLYLTVHQPLGWMEHSWREGGPLNQWITRRGRLAMIEAARRLPPLPAAPPDAPEVCFLTGRRFWYQTAFCFWSLCRHSGRSFTPVFIDDGSFDDALRAECLRLFPGARIPSRDEINSRMEAALPAARFPALTGQRRTYLHLRKITDAHAGLNGWRLVLDSDMLFFRRPDALLAWCDAPAKPVHMLDVENAYGYPMETLVELAGGPIPTKINVGVCGLHSDAIDWEKLEWCCARLLARHGTSYYLEQALVALLLAGRETTLLPPSDYRLMPDEKECRAPQAVLHHYVAESKRGYFRHAWKILHP
ncbi:MAG: glycosyl transferase [Rariglobus sp.]|nr:glycosyl transferase family 2 [Rariglobus sp.]